MATVTHHLSSQLSLSEIGKYRTREKQRETERDLGQIWTLWKWASFANGKIVYKKLIRKRDYERKGKGLRKKEQSNGRQGNIYGRLSRDEHTIALIGAPRLAFI